MAKANDTVIKNFVRPKQQHLDKKVAEYWANLAVWDKEEALILVTGENPLFIEECRQRGDTYAVKKQWHQRQEIGPHLSKHTDIDSDYGIAKPPRSPADWIAVFDLVNVPVPSVLRKAVEKYKHPTPKIDKLLSTREKNTYLKLIAAMAVHGYGRSDGNFAGLAPKIEADTQKIGNRVSDDTIAKILKDAAIFVEK